MIMLEDASFVSTSSLYLVFFDYLHSFTPVLTLKIRPNSVDLYFEGILKARNESEKSSFVEIGLQIRSQEQKRLEPLHNSEESAPITFVTIIIVNENAKRR